MWKKIQAFIMCAVLMLSLNIGLTAFADGDITVKLTIGVPGLPYTQHNKVT